MTAPWKRTDVDDVAGVNRKRIRSLEANCCTEDATYFDPVYNGEDVYPQLPIHSDGTTDPVVLYSSWAYVTGNLVATASFYFTLAGTAGDGNYYITLPHINTQLPYAPQTSFFSNIAQVGPAYCYDDSAGDWRSMILRISPTVTILGGQCLEAWDPTTGLAWSATAPFTWATDDILLAATFNYFLEESLLGPKVY